MPPEWRLMKRPLCYHCLKWRVFAAHAKRVYLLSLKETRSDHSPARSRGGEVVAASQGRVLPAQGSVRVASLPSNGDGRRPFSTRQLYHFRLRINALHPPFPVILPHERRPKIEPVYQPRRDSAPAVSFLSRFGALFMLIGRR
jgi:hypothetical protein